MAELEPDQILTDEEMRILVLIAQEYSISSIVKMTRLNKRRVEIILGHIYRKLGVSGAQGAVAQAFLRGILNKYYVPVKKASKYGGSYQELTPRERDSLSWVACNLSHSEIARKLSVDRTTVSHYIYLAKHKLGAPTTEEAIEIAKLNDLLNKEIFAA